MKTRCFTLNGRGVLIIPTPGGLIEIHRVPGDNRKLMVTTPEGMEPAIGSPEESKHKALSSSTMLREDGDGRVVPTFTLMAPRMNKGELDGVHVPGALVLEDAQP